MSRKIEYPTYKRGDLVRLKKDKMRYPVFDGVASDPYVFVPAGTVGTVSHHITPGNVIVLFRGDYSHASGLALSVLSEVEAIDVSELGALIQRPS